MRTIGVLTVFLIAGITFIFVTNQHWRENSTDLKAFIIIVAVVAVTGITAAIISWRHRRARVAS
jgi:hypothetical protein